MSSEELQALESLKAGVEAQAAFFEEHAELLRRLARCRITNQLNRRFDSSDILQEAFLEYTGRVDAYLANPRVPPVVWLRRLVRQVIYRKTRDNLDAQCRDVRREKYMEDESKINVDVLSASLSSVGHGIANAELHSKVRAVISSMSPNEQEILTLIHYEARTIREAALELDIQLETAKKRYSRAISRLRDICLNDLSTFAATPMPGIPNESPQLPNAIPDMPGLGNPTP